MAARVVGAAIMFGGCVLAARRRAPAALAGLWEFPGGKVEAGESDAQALVRECREELSVEIAVGELIGTAQLDDGGELAIYLAEHLIGFPEPHHHEETRWVAPAALAALEWVPADRAIAAALAGRLIRELGRRDG